MKQISFTYLLLCSLLFQAYALQDTTATTPHIDNETQNDTIQSSGADPTRDTTESELDETDSAETDDSTALFERLDKGFYVSPSWQFGSSPLLTTWFENQQDKKEYYDSLFMAQSNSDSTISLEKLYTQKPLDQSITFPFSMGIYKKIDSTKSFSLGVDYAFQRKRSIFTYKNKLDSTVLYENNSSISVQRLSLLASFEYTFNKEYFSVKGFPRTGITLGIGGSPLNWVKLKNNGSVTTENAYGGIWNAGVFTEKNISETVMRRVIIFYTGSITQAYNSFTSALPTYSGYSYVRSGSFGIKILFIFSRGTTESEPQT